VNLLNRIEALRKKEDRLVIGLSSGTSADGVDVALVRVQGNGLSTEVSPVAGSTFPYDPATQQAVLAVGELTAAEICRMNYSLGETFAEIPAEEKSRLSHRGEAVRAMVRFLRRWEPPSSGGD